MANTEMIVDGTTMYSNDVKYAKAKINPSGGKNVSIQNSKTGRALFVSSPCMLTWGVNEYVDEASGRKTYDMSLQFPKNDYKTDVTSKFLESMKAFEMQIKSDVQNNCKEWFNKSKLSEDVVDALWTPMLKYPKDPETGEPDESRPPTLRIKFQFWEGEWKCELYDVEYKPLFPNDQSLTPHDLIEKGTHVATIMQCGGLWFVNGKFGVTWKLVQAVVKPKESLRGKCFISLSASEKATMSKDTTSPSARETTSLAVEDSSDDDETAAASDEVTKEITALAVDSTPVVEKPKKVARKKVVKSAE